MAMLEGAVQGEPATGKAAKVDGVRVAGKTGTAEWTTPDDDKKHIYSSFVGILPADAPRYVILVGVEAPRDDAPGGKVAAPAFARIATRALSVKR
jgi:cell division protein FtsI (penicillin-binding protein 3)